MIDSQSEFHDVFRDVFPVRNSSIFFLNIFSGVINLLLTTLAGERPGPTRGVSALSLFCTDVVVFGLYCQDLGQILPVNNFRAWLHVIVHYLT